MIARTPDRALLTRVFRFEQTWLPQFLDTDFRELQYAGGMAVNADLVIDLLTGQLDFPAPAGLGTAIATCATGLMRSITATPLREPSSGGTWLMTPIRAATRNSTVASSVSAETKAMDVVKNGFIGLQNVGTHTSPRWTLESLRSGVG